MDRIFVGLSCELHCRWELNRALTSDSRSASSPLSMSWLPPSVWTLSSSSMAWGQKADIILLPLSVSMADILEVGISHSSRTLSTSSRMFYLVWFIGMRRTARVTLFCDPCRSRSVPWHTSFAPNICTDTDFHCLKQERTNFGFELNHHLIDLLPNSCVLALEQCTDCP